MAGSPYPYTHVLPEYSQLEDIKTQLVNNASGSPVDLTTVNNRIISIDNRDVLRNNLLTSLDNRFITSNTWQQELAGGLVTPSSTWENHGGRNLFGTTPVIHRAGATRLSSLKFQNFDTTRVYLVLLNLSTVALTVGSSIFGGRVYSFDNNGFIHLDHNYWNEPGSQIGLNRVAGLLFVDGLWVGLSTSPETWQPAPLTSSFRIEISGS